METLLDGIPLDKMNTSMTINAPAAWLLSLYIAAAERRGVARAQALRHHPERHHQGIPVARHLHLPAGAVDAADLRRDRLHLQGSAEVEPDQRLLLPPAGGGRDAGAGTGLRARHRHRRSRRGEGFRQVPADDFPQVVGRISFFCNAGIRFITEMCKMRAFSELWDEICQQRYGVEDESCGASAMAYRSTRWG